MNPVELFAEPTLKQVTVWSRGVILVKDGRDVSFLLANAGRMDGKHVQAFENYVDLPDRVGVPVSSFARFADEPIESRFLYENTSHDVVVLVEETLVRGPVLNNMNNGGVLVVNTRRTAAEIARFLPRHPHLKYIVTVDAAGIAKGKFTLSGQEGASDAEGFGDNLGGPLAAEVAKATGYCTLESLMKVAKDPVGIQRGWDLATITPAQELFERGIGKPFTGDVPAKVYETAPFAGTVPAPDKRNTLMVTGTWRTLRPVLNADLCTQCLVCVVDCPDACITLNKNAVAVDYEYCKGCGICTAVCPTEAFRDEPELDFVS